MRHASQLDDFDQGTTLNILLITLGSAGDVHPFVGLGRALQHRGHFVKLATNAHFRTMIEQAGLAFAQLGDEAQFHQLTANPDLWHPIKGLRTVFEGALLPMIHPVHDLIARERDAGPLLVVSHGIAFGARLAEEKLHIPNSTVHLAPLVFRSLHRHPVYQGMPMASWMPRWLKQAMFRLSDLLVIERVMCPPVNTIRREMNLPPIHSVQSWWNSPRRIIGMFPDWFAPIQPDWPPQLRLSGFPLFDQGDMLKLPADLEGFLNQGTLPIVFTAGSAMCHAADFFRQSALACQRLGRRGLLVSRYPDQLPADLPPQIRPVAYAPFSQLLPRCAAFVHHGGIGTSAQGLHAGLPALVVPLSHDQFDNAARLVRLGTAQILPRQRYRAPKVAAMLRQLLTNPRYTQYAHDASERMARTDGLEIAATLVEQMTPATIS